MSDRLSNPALRLGLFAALAVVVFALAALAGSAIDPARGGAERGEHQPKRESRGHEPRGLAVSHGGLRLVAEDTTLRARGGEPFRFRLEDRGGSPVRDFDVEHDRRMHVIAVRRDLTGYRHVHPRLTSRGTWETDLRLAEAGSYRLFADFSHRGRPHTLGVDVSVPGRFQPRPLPPPADRVRVGGGYEVLARERGGELRFTVTRHGEELDDIEPYLGARGHLVALRDGDLAFLHVHPEDEATAGRGIRFAVEYPSRGRYRLFLQFKHEGRVHTAAFTRAVGRAGEHREEEKKEVRGGHGH